MGSVGRTWGGGFHVGTFGEGPGGVAFEDVGPDVAGDDLTLSRLKKGERGFFFSGMESWRSLSLRAVLGTGTYGGDFDSGHRVSGNGQGNQDVAYPSGAISTLSVFAQWARAAFVAL